VPAVRTRGYRRPLRPCCPRRAQRETNDHLYAVAMHGPWGAHRSLCPSCFSGAIRSRTSCFSSFDSGNRPSRRREKIVSPSSLTSRMPFVPGTSATSPSSLSKVVNSSCASYAARRSQRHCRQYSISRRGVMSRSSGVTVRFVNLPRPPRGLPCIVADSCLTPSPRSRRSTGANDTGGPSPAVISLDSGDGLQY
jgi:hypothetical protein